MAIDLLAISIGNTRTKFGAFGQDNLRASQAIANDRLGAELPAAVKQAYEQLDNDEAPVLLASVNPNLADQVIAIAARETGRSVLRVERDLPIPIGRQLDREALVGEDRLLNAAAAYDVLKQACIVVDAGTAITVDFIDGVGTFHGGAIGPGAHMMLNALHVRTALLPEVTFARPAEAIGHNTVEAMRVAVYYGLRGMVRELVEQYAQIAGAFPMVVATGGDSETLFEGFELVERIVPDLTLLGLAVTMRRANEAAEADELE
ncbi:MAG: type III pantothenate kinase [Phycisphaeraceae bacterium]